MVDARQIRGIARLLNEQVHLAANGEWRPFLDSLELLTQTDEGPFRRLVHLVVDRICTTRLSVISQGWNNMFTTVVGRGGLGCYGAAPFDETLLFLLDGGRFLWRNSPDVERIVEQHFEKGQYAVLLFAHDFHRELAAPSEDALDPEDAHRVNDVTSQTERHRFRCR